MSLRTSTGRGRVAATEIDIVLGHLPTWRKDASTPALVYCHGANGTAGSVFANAPERALLDELARKFTVVLADLGGNTCGNDTAIARVEAAVAYAQSAAWKAKPGKVVLAGFSMGALVSLAYTLAHPTAVAAVALCCPGLDINDAVVNNRGGFASLFNAAYGGAYDDAVHGPTHSPVRYATSLPADLPIKLWTSSTDPVAVPATADAFVTARPQTQRVDVGAQGHSSAVVGVAAAEMAAFCAANRP